MSLIWSHRLRASLRFPRVSGDEPMLDLTVRAMTAFSPRERG